MNQCGAPSINLERKLLGKQEGAAARDTVRMCSLICLLLCIGLANLHKAKAKHDGDVVQVAMPAGRPDSWSVYQVQGETLSSVESSRGLCGLPQLQGMAPLA